LSGSGLAAIRGEAVSVRKMDRRRRIPHSKSQKNLAPILDSGPTARGPGARLLVVAEIATPSALITTGYARIGAGRSVQGNWRALVFFKRFGIGR